MKLSISKKLTAGIATFIMLATSMFTMSAAHAQSVTISGGPHDCDSNAVIKCGVKSVNDIQSEYKKSSSTRVIYAYFGISSSDINGLDKAEVVSGQVTKSGNVIVKGKIVATDALTAGRQYIKGSTKVTKDGVTFYTRKPSVSFQSNSLEAFVVMKNGVFQYAILAACGNPIKATPPKPPKPQPVMACDQLAFSKKENDYTLTAQASAKNATIVAYNFTFGDGQTKTVTSSKTSAAVTHTYEPGSYAANVSVTFDANGKKQTITSAKCSAKITLEQPAAAVTCDQLTFENKELAFDFAATGSAKNATINSFVFDFGDGTDKKTVNAVANKAAASHTYTKTGDYTASVVVNYTDLNGKKGSTSSAKCAVKVSPKQPMCTVPGKENLPADSPECVPTPVFACDLLLISNKSTDTTSLQYAFTVKASATNATIESYSINFGDGTPAYIGAAPAVEHSYAKPGTYAITASVKIKGQDQAVTSAACTGSVTITPPMCTVPGKENLPADSPECVPTTTPPTTPPETPETPATLPNTGAGTTIGLFSGIVVAGTAAHRIFASRRLFGLGR